MTEPTTEAPTKLNISPQHWADICTAGSDWTSPNERCGIMFGSIVNGEAFVAGVAELDNVAADPEHNYEFAPATQAKAWSRVERWGYEVFAVWHTHPSGPEQPSETDVANMQTFLLYPVVYPGEGGVGCAMSVWCLNATGDGANPVPYEVVEEAPVVAERAMQSQF